jgi:hypothetical protein
VSNLYACVDPTLACATEDGIMTDDPTLTVARDLRAIVDLSCWLLAQARAKATHHDLPGGDAMVMLANVALPSSWERRIELIEADWLRRRGDDWCEQHGTIMRLCAHRANPWADEDGICESPLQTMLFWTEDQHETPHPTIAGEATWLRDNLRWFWDNEPNFADLADDVAAARRRLEAVLYAGDRDVHGVIPCRECDGELDRLALDRRPCRCPEPPPHAWHVPGRCCRRCRWEERHALHDQGGLRDAWVCRRCHHAYDLDEYRAAVARDARDNATALTADALCERFPDVTVGQVRVWANRGLIKRQGRDEMGRMLYDVADVEARVEGLLAS